MGQPFVNGNQVNRVHYVAKCRQQRVMRREQHRDLESDGIRQGPNDLHEQTEQEDKESYLGDVPAEHQRSHFTAEQREAFLHGL